MKHSILRSWLGIIGIFGVFSLSGCTQANIAMQTQTVTIFPSFTSTKIFDLQIKTLTPVPSSTPIVKISTASTTPTRNIPTQTPTRLPYTPTPAPTLSIADAQALILGFMRNNGGCEFPCLWGITPGKTDPNAMNAFLAQFGTIRTTAAELYNRDHGDTGGIIDIFIWKENLIYFVDLTLYNIAGSPKQLVISASLWEEIHLSDDSSNLERKDKFDDPSYNQWFPYFTLSNILSVYGKPSLILVQVFQGDPQEWQPFNVMLVFEDKQTVIAYTMTRGWKKGGFYVGCPNQSHFQVTSWAAETGLTWKQAAEKFDGYWVNAATIDYYLPIDEATFQGELAPFWSVESFYEEFKQLNSTACLETPVGLWNGP